jgi:hypothetical protein
MPRYCPNCAFQTPELLDNVCPHCNTPLALSPRGRADRPQPAAGRPKSRRLWIVLGVLAAIIVLPLVYMGLVYADPEPFLGDESLRDSTGRLGVGMPVKQAAGVLELSPADTDRVSARGFKGSVTRARGGRVVRVTVWTGHVNGIRDGDLPIPVPGWTKIEEDPR